MNLINTYFYTATILNWNSLLKNDEFKNIIINSLQFLVDQGKLKVYAFVIMPNHIHLIWRNIEMNGKEFPDNSFLKFTAHQFKKRLEAESVLLKKFLVNKADRKYQFWQRSPLDIEILSKEMLEQKLEYIHFNPIQQHWGLVEIPESYFYSSCGFYEKNSTSFKWITDYREDF